MNGQAWLLIWQQAKPVVVIVLGLCLVLGPLYLVAALIDWCRRLRQRATGLAKPEWRSLISQAETTMQRLRSSRDLSNRREQLRQGEQLLRQLYSQDAGLIARLVETCPIDHPVAQAIQQELRARHDSQLEVEQFLRR